MIKTDFYQNNYSNTRVRKKVNFGVNYNTHVEVTREALRRFPGFSRISAQVADASKLPDLLKKELGFYTNKHFFFPPSKWFKFKSFGLNPEKNNALAAFGDHLTKFYNYKIHKLPQKYATKELGMAIHYMQDAAVPMHTERSTFMGKIFDFWLHKNFEKGTKRGILANQDLLAQNYVPGYKKLAAELPQDYTVYDLFKSNVEFSRRKDLQVSRFNKKEWPRIQQEVYNRIVDSSILYFKRIKEFIKAEM